MSLQSDSVKIWMFNLIYKFKILEGIHTISFASQQHLLANIRSYTQPWNIIYLSFFTTYAT